MSAVAITYGVVYETRKEHKPGPPSPTADQLATQAQTLMISINKESRTLVALDKTNHRLFCKRIGHLQRKLHRMDILVNDLSAYAGAQLEAQLQAQMTRIETGVTAAVATCVQS